jgi:multiple sugar transport system permease protein
MIRSSVIPLHEILKMPIVWIPENIVLSNFTQALTVLPFGRFFMNTTIILVLSVMGILFSGTLAAYSFSRLDWPGRDIVFYILMTTLMLPSFATLIPTFLGWRSVGALNSYLPLIIPNWFCGGATGSFSSVFYIFLLRQFFMGIPKDLDEAAKVDGASHLRVYFQIILPLAKPAIMVVVLFASFSIWNDFLSPSIYLNEVEKYTLNLGLRLFSGMYNAQWNLMMAAATVVTIPPIILFAFGQKYFIEGITFSGIKG